MEHLGQKSPVGFDVVCGIERRVSENEVDEMWRIRTSTNKRMIVAQVWAFWYRHLISWNSPWADFEKEPCPPCVILSQVVLRNLIQMGKGIGRIEQIMLRKDNKSKETI